MTMESRNMEHLFEEYQAWYKFLNGHPIPECLSALSPDNHPRITYQLATPDLSSEGISRVLRELGYGTPQRTTRDGQAQPINTGILRAVSPRKCILDLRELGTSVGADLSA